VDAQCVRWRLRSSLTHFQCAALRCSDAAFALDAHADGDGAREYSTGRRDGRGFVR
jgi:hypothetical protein